MLRCCGVISQVTMSLLRAKSSISSAVVVCRMWMRLPAARASAISRLDERSAVSASRTSGWLVQSPGRARGLRSTSRLSSSEWKAARRRMAASTVFSPSSSAISSEPVEEPTNTLTPQQPGSRSSSPRSRAFSWVPPI